MKLDSEPNRSALARVRADLSPDGRRDLGHLLRNALAPVAIEVDLLGRRDEDLREDLSELRVDLADLRALVEALLKP